MGRQRANPTPLEGGAGIRRLEDAVVLEVAGEDAHEWLNGQVTNAIRQTAPGDAVYALFTTVKGKILADGWILHVERGDGHDVLWAVVPRSARDALLESFDKYIVMEDVEVRARDDLAVVTVQGPRAGEIVAKVPAAREGAWACDRLGTGGRDVVLCADRVEGVTAALRDAGAEPVDEATWELVRVRRGVPRFGRDFDERSYPQEAGLKRRAVSFTKGCYVGQEVVCMLENRGKLSKRLVALELAGEAAPDTPLESDGKTVGRITSAVADPAGPIRALGYVKDALTAPGTELRAGPHRARVIAPLE